MSAELGVGYLSIIPETSKIAGTIKQAFGDAGDVGGKEASKGLLSGLGGAAIKVGGIAAGAISAVGGIISGLSLKGGIDRLLNIEDATAKLTGLGNSADDVKSIMNNALAAVKGAAFGMGDAATVAAGAVAAGIKPGKELERVLRLTGDAATIAGTGLGEMGSIFNKVAASGKLQGDVIAQLQDAGVPILQMVAKEMGVTAAEASKMASEGKVDFETFANAMENGLGGAALKSGDTVRGSLANMRASFSRLGADAASVFMPLMKDVFGQITTTVDGVATKVKPFLAQFAGWFQGIAGPAIAGFSTKALAAFSTVGAAVSGLSDLIFKGDFTGKLTQAFHIEEDSKVVDVILSIRDAIVQIASGLTMGAAAREQFAGQLDGWVLAGAKVRQLFDGPLTQSFVTLMPGVLGLISALSPLQIIFTALLPVLPQLAEIAGMLATVVTTILNVALTAAAPLLESLASIVAGVLVPTIQVLVPLIAGLAGWMKDNTDIVIVLLAAYAGFRLVTGIMAGFKAVMLGTQAAQLGFAAASYGAAAATYAQGNAGKFGLGVGKVWTSVTKGMAVAQGLLNAAWAFSPIGVVIAGILLLVGIFVLAYNRIGWFKDAVDAAFSFIVTVISGAADWIVSVWGGFMGWIAAVVSGFASWWNGVWSGISAVIGFAWGLIVAYVTGYINVVLSIITAVVGFILAVWAGFWNGPFGQLIQAAFGLVFAILNYAWQWIALIFTVISTAVSSAWSALWNAVVAVVTTAWNAIVAFLTVIINFVVAIISAYINMVLAIWTAIWTAISDFFMGIWNGIVSFLTVVGTAIVNAVSGPLYEAWSFVTSILGSIGQFFADTWNGISSGVRVAFEMIVGVIRDKISQITGFVTGIKDAVMNAFAGAGQWLVDIGGKIIQGLIDGFMGMVNDVTNSLKFLTDLIPKNKGPESRDKVLLKGNGRLIIGGLIDGLESKYPDVASSLGGLTTGMAVGMVPSAPAFDAGASGSRLGSGAIVNQHIYPREEMSEQRLADIASRKLLRYA